MNRLSINYLPAVLVLLAALVAATPAAAQFGPGRFGPDVPPEERVERHVQRLDARLDLTDQQEEQVRAVLLDHHQEGRAWLEANPDATREERRAYRYEHRAALREALAGVLTSEQTEALAEFQSRRDKMRSDRSGKRGGPGLHGHRGGPSGPSGPMLMNRLDLSDEQQARLQELREEHWAEAKAWMEAHPDATREERQAFMQEHRTEVRSVLEDVLTDEQLEQFEAMWQTGPRQGQRPGMGLRGRRGGMMRGNLMGRLADELELTQEQRDQAREIVAEHREEGRAWREANPEATREERRVFMQEHHQALMTKLEGVLTDEQADELDALKARWQARRPGVKPDAETSQQQATGDEQEVAAAAFSLENYPNPFNPSTDIRFTLEEAADVELVVYDVQGREVARLLDARLTAGQHGATFDASDLSSGVYLYRLTAGDRTASGRMTLVK